MINFASFFGKQDSGFNSRPRDKNGYFFKVDVQ